MNYLLKITLILLAFNSAVSRGLDKQQVPEAKKLYDQTFRVGASYQHVRNLSQAQRELLLEYRNGAIEEMRRRGENDRQIADSSAVLDLALLGDDWAREQVVKAFWYQPRERANGLLALKDPKAIAMLGEGLFLEETYYSSDDVGYKPTQENIAEVVIDTLGHSPEFNADVINWARRVEVRSSITLTEAIMGTMREWYRANEAKLKAGDFKAVQPGAEPPDPKVFAPAGLEASFLPAGSKPPTAPVSFPGQSPEISGNVYAWIAALLLAVCGGLAWLLKRKRI